MTDMAPPLTIFNQMEVNMKVLVETELDAEFIAERLDQDQAMNLIKELDAWQVDYDFTLQLARYLVAELKKSAPPEEPFSLADLE